MRQACCLFAHVALLLLPLSLFLTGSRAVAFPSVASCVGHSLIKTGHKGKKGTSPLSGGDPYEITLIRLNTQSSEFGQKEEGESHLGDDLGA